MGGFDDSFFAHQEEIDLCWRMQLACWRIAVEPRSRVYHLGAGTLPPSPAKVYYNHRNNLAMLYKNLPAGKCGVTIALRMILDGVLAVWYIMSGERANFNAVLSAHRNFRKMKREGLRGKRHAIQSTATSKPTGIYRGSIVLRYLFSHRTFDNLL
jgi:GT2 family glycosyltransferase